MRQPHPDPDTNTHFYDEGSYIEAKRIGDGTDGISTTNPTYVSTNKKQQTYYKLLDNSQLLAIEMFGGKLMEMMTEKVSPQGGSLRTPSPRSCNSPTGDKKVFCTSSIKDPNITYNDVTDIGSKITQNITIQQRFIQFATMRQFIQDGDAAPHNYEIPEQENTLNEHHVLSLDYGLAFIEITNSWLEDSIKKNLPIAYRKPKTKEELLVSLLFDKTDYSGQLQDSHSIIQDGSIIKTNSIQEKMFVVKTVITTLQALCKITHRNKTACLNFTHEEMQRSRENYLKHIKTNDPVIKQIYEITQQTTAEEKLRIYESLYNKMISKSFRKTIEGQCYKIIIMKHLNQQPKQTAPSLQSWHAKLKNLCQAGSIKELKNIGMTTPMHTNRALMIFSQRLYLAKKLFQGRCLSFDPKIFKQNYISWVKRYTYTTKGAEMESFELAAEEWLTAIKDASIGIKQDRIRATSPHSLFNNKEFRSLSDTSQNNVSEVSVALTHPS